MMAPLKARKLRILHFLQEEECLSLPQHLARTNEIDHQIRFVLVVNGFLLMMGAIAQTEAFLMRRGPPTVSPIL
jgi:hypothetical protein